MTESSSQPAQPTRRQRDRDRRRNEILDAAGRVFVARGFRDATMDDVAKEAELSKGTLYLYFESKEALFLSLATRSLQNVISAFEEIAAAATAGDGATRFRQMLHAYANHVLANKAKFRVMIGRLASNPTVDVEKPEFHAHRECVQKLVGLLVGSLEAGCEDGSLRAELEPLPTAMEAWGGMLGVLLITINFDELDRRLPGQVDKSRIVPEFIDNLVRGLRSHQSS